MSTDLEGNAAIVLESRESTTYPEDSRCLRRHGARERGRRRVSDGAFGGCPS